MLSTRVEHTADGVAALGVLGAVGWFLAPFLFDQAIVVERDALSSILPIRAFLARALESGSWPMWNPYPVLGKPFLPEWQTGLFYPPSLWLLVAPFSRGFNAFFVFHYASTALGAFLLFRALGAPRMAAVLGALVWALGGPLVSLGHLLNHLMAVSWLPWVLWGWARSDRLRSQIVFATVFLTIALLAGSPEMVAVIAVLLVVMSRDLRSLAVPPLAALAASAQLVPVWLYLEQTHRGAYGLPMESVFRFSTSLGRLGEFFYPSTSAPENFLPTVYVGTVSMALAIIGLFFAPARVARMALLVLLVLVVLALGSNALVLPLLYDYVPGVDLLRFPEKFLVGVHALIALGATFGLAAVARRLPARGATALVLLACAIIDLSYNNRGALFSMPPEDIFSPPEIARVMRAPSHTNANTLVRYYASSTNTPRSSTVGEAVAMDRDLLYAQTGELYGLANVNSPASLNLVEHERLQRSLENLSQSRALGVLSALGTRWVTSFVPLGDDGAIQEVPLASGKARLYSLETSSPRAFIAENVLMAPNPRAALARFLDTDPAELSTTAVVEGGAGESISYRAPTQPQVSWVDSDNDSLKLEVSANAPALLVINDSFAPGWRASVDGAPAGVERVNGLVRGIWLTPGEHEVQLHYRAPGLPLGMALSLVALTLLGLIWLPRSYWNERRPEPQPEPVQPRLMFPRGS